MYRETATPEQMWSKYILCITHYSTVVCGYSWIASSVARQELKEINETYKLKMYKALAWTLGTFVILFTTLTVAMLTADGSQQSWQWKWEWTQVVSWEVRTQLLRCSHAVFFIGPSCEIIKAREARQHTIVALRVCAGMFLGCQVKKNNVDKGTEHVGVHLMYGTDDPVYISSGWASCIA